MKTDLSSSISKFIIISLIICLNVGSTFAQYQKYTLGAIPPTKEEYNRLPKVDWSILQKNSDRKSIALENRTLGIVMLNNPEIGNQGYQGSCVGWAVGYAAVSILAYPKFNNDWNLAKRSPSYVFNQIQTGQCESSYLTSGLNLVKNQGVCSISMMPYNVNDCTTLPNNSQRFDAVLNNILNWGTLNANDISGIKNSLELGYPVVINFAVTESFDNMWDNNGIWNSSNINDTIRGYHAACVVGYDDSIQMFKVQNSWGMYGGDNGYFWVTYNLVQNNCLSGVYVLSGINQSVYPTLSGPSTICDQGTFTINNLPQGATVNWSYSINLRPLYRYRLYCIAAF